MKPSKTTERKNLMNNTKMRTWAFTVFTLLLSLLREISFSAGVGDISSIISSSKFEEMLPHRDHPPCYAVGFYTYDAFIKAAEVFPDFGNIGNDTTREREIAAFFGQISQETTEDLSLSFIWNWKTNDTKKKRKKKSGKQFPVTEFLQDDKEEKLIKETKYFTETKESNIIAENQGNIQKNHSHQLMPIIKELI